MRKPNYSHEKRQREIAKQKKREAKKLKKNERANANEEEVEDDGMEPAHIAAAKAAYKSNTGAGQILRSLARSKSNTDMMQPATRISIGFKISHLAVISIGPR